MKRKIISLIIKLIIIEVVYFVLFFVVFGLSRVRTNIMEPNMNGGDLAFYYHFDKSCQVGDIVAVKTGSSRNFLRVLACSGDEVDISEAGDIYVNGVQPDIDKVFSGKSDPDDGISLPYRVPENSFFLVGDNRNEVGDSRILGAYLVEDIDGKVISILRTRGL